MLDKELLNYISEKKKYLYLITFFNVIGLLINVGTTFLLSFMIKDFIDQNYIDAIVKICVSIGLIVVRIVLYKLSSFLSTSLANYVTYKLRNDTYLKYLKVHGKTPFSIQEMAQLSTEGIEQLRLYFSTYIPSFFYAMIAPILLFIIFVFIDYKVALIYLAAVPLIPISIILVSKRAKRIFNKYRDQYTSLGDSFLDNVYGMKELKIFTFDKAKEEKMKEESEEFRKITMKVLTMQLASITIMDLVAYGGAGLGIILSLIAMQNGLSVYLTLFLILVGAEFFLPLRGLGSSFHVAMNGATAGKKVIKLLNENDYVDGTKNIQEIKNIKVKNLSFSYEDEKILDDISVELSTGFNSIVGVSGSGKSTLAKLTSKILKANEGEILFDDLNIDEIQSNSFYEKVCYVSNNSFLFHTSIRENFKFYNSRLSDEKMLSLLKEVRLENLSLDLVINDTISNISGGEKQRLILAFYLSKEFDFYIFDEATSNIDVESEEIILNKIYELSKSKIVLFISHRLKSVINSNNIYYLGNKKIIANGDFKSLKVKCVEFARLYDYQNNLESEAKYEKA